MNRCRNEHHGGTDQLVHRQGQAVVPSQPRGDEVIDVPADDCADGEQIAGAAALGQNAEVRADDEHDPYQTPQNANIDFAVSFALKEHSLNENGENRCKRQHDGDQRHRHQGHGVELALKIADLTEDCASDKNRNVLLTEEFSVLRQEFQRNDKERPDAELKEHETLR